MRHQELWKPILIDGKPASVPYMISNRGRFGVKKEGGEITLRKFKPSGGYYRYNIRHKGKNKALFLFKEVARAFLKKPSTAHRFVIHKDHNYLNDSVENLAWATASSRPCFAPFACCTKPEFHKGAFPQGDPQKQTRQGTG